MKTREEVETLKWRWSRCPIDSWLEDAEGFEEYRHELLAFRQECEANWEADRKRRHEEAIAELCKPAIELLGETAVNHVRFGTGAVLRAVAEMLLPIKERLGGLSERLDEQSDKAHKGLAEDILDFDRAVRRIVRSEIE